MKTLVMFNQFESYNEEPDVFFFELEGDYSHLNNVFIGSYPSDASNTTELTGLVYDEDGKKKVQVLSKPTKDWDFFIYCGFLL